MRRLSRVGRSVDPWLVVAVAVGAALRFSRLGDFDNRYYTATVVSMLQGPANFLFGAFDPLGLVSVDKPPASFWVQAVPVALFGPRPWAVSLPQAVAGTAAIAALYFALRPAFGRVAAAAAALALAVIPASVIIDSRNEPDSLLSFTLLVAAIAIIRAAGRGSWRWLLLFAVLMGIAFNMKMLVAFVPLPAFLLFFVLRSRLTPAQTAIRSSVMLGVLLAVSFSWATLVALTPPDRRPYVGSTPDNSVWTLIFRYNGLDRFGGFRGLLRPAQGGPGPAGIPGPGAAPSGPPAPIGPAPGQPDGPGPGAQAAPTGVWSLLSPRLAAQTGWLLPLALVSLVVALIPLLAEEVYRSPRALLGRLRERPALAEALLWAGWLATGTVVFGLADATTTHPYYLVGLAVPLAAVLGIGYATLWRAHASGPVWAWALPVAVGGALLYQVLGSTRAVPDWTVAFAVGLAAAAFVVLAVAAVKGLGATPLAGAFAIVGGLAVLVVPAVYVRGEGGPLVGPPAGGLRPPGPARQAPEERRVQSVASLLGSQGAGGAIATVSAREAAPFIIGGIPAIAIGGFSGRDPIVSRQSFEALAREGRVRYFLLPGEATSTGPRPDSREAQAEVQGWVRGSWEDISPMAGLPPGTLFRYRPLR